MQEDLGDEGMAKIEDTVARHTFTKERQAHAISELSDHQLIRHPSNITLRIVLSRLQTKTEELLAEEQAGFRPGRRI